jgi:glycosyltransferase involved in cell wall biosynthesis
VKSQRSAHLQGPSWHCHSRDNTLKNASPIRVAYVITGLDTGGAEAMLERLIMSLGPRVRPLVISLTDLGVVGPRLQANGVDVRALGMRRGRVPSLRLWWQLVQLLRRFGADVVHTHMCHADLVGGLAARAAGVRAVMWNVHLSNLDAGLNARSTLWTLRVCALLSRVLPQRIACVAERSRDAHVSLGYVREKCVVIPNGFDMSQFQPDACARLAVRTELGLAADTPLVAVIGRFDVLKNHRGFCEAMAHLLTLRPGVHALLAGTGIDANNHELMAWMQAHGVAQACHLLGPRQDVPRLMAALDVLLLPSLGEAFPNVVGEAMACGVPCAVTDVGDAAVMVGDCGRVVPSGDMRGLAAAAANLLALGNDERAQLRQQTATSARQRYDLQAVSARFLTEYTAMLTANSPTHTG